MKHTVIAFLVGALLSGGAAGGYGFVKVYELSQENSRLGSKVKQQRAELQTLKKAQDSLNTEF